MAAPISFDFIRPQAAAKAGPPSETVAITHDEMIADGIVIAKYNANQWQVPDGEKYSSVEFRVPVDVRFTDGATERSRTLGPYSKFSMMDGVAYALGHVFAFSDHQNRDWYSYDLGKHWAQLVLTSAAS